MQGRTCRWVDNCTFVHLKRVEDLQLENQKLFKAEISSNPKLSWAHNNNSNGTKAN